MCSELPAFDDALAIGDCTAAHVDVLAHHTRSRRRIHHIDRVTDGGTTILSNLVPLRETHHHLVLEGGWNLHIDDHRHPT